MGEVSVSELLAEKVILHFGIILFLQNILQSLNSFTKLLKIKKIPQYRIQKCMEITQISVERREGQNINSLIHSLLESQ